MFNGQRISPGSLTTLELSLQYALRGFLCFLPDEPCHTPASPRVKNTNEKVIDIESKQP